MLKRVVSAAALVLAVAASPAAAAQPDGSLVQVTGNPKVFRIIGGAPLWIGTCAYTNGCQGLTQTANLDEYGPYPRDGAVTFGGSDEGIYRWAGGAPLWLSRCDYGGGCASMIQIDDVSYFKDLEHVRRVPVDSTVIRNVDDGGYYRFAGGAPLLVRCDIGPNCVNPPQFDGGTFSNLGSVTTGRANMRRYPADGTTVSNLDDGVFYRFAGGAPLPLSSCAGCSVPIIDNRTLQLAGTATPSQPHLLAVPADGTFLTTGAATYRVAGGAAVQITDCTRLDGCPGAVTVDAGTIASRGGGRLLAAPADGTVLRGLPSGTLWEIVGGKRRQTFVRVTGIDVDDGALAALAIDVSPPPPATPEPFVPAITSSYTVNRKGTRFKALSVRNVPAGSKLTITCSRKSRGCPFRSKNYTKSLKNGRANLVSRFKSRRLRGGVTLAVKITGPTGARKYGYFKLRTMKLPVRSTRCSAPGGKLGKC